jgi:ACT domain-containing protein
MGTRTVISVLGADRTGIVAALATTLANYGASIDDISQTIMGGIFVMTMMVTLNDEQGSFNQVQDALAKNAEELNLQVTIQRADVFKVMHEI